MVADREGVAAPTAAAGDGDQRQIATQQRMKWRAEHCPHDGIRGAIEHRERLMTVRHDAKVSQPEQHAPRSRPAAIRTWPVSELMKARMYRRACRRMTNADVAPAR